MWGGVKHCKSTAKILKLSQPERCKLVSNEFQNQHFLGLLLSLGTGNIIKKPRWSRAFGGEPQSCGQDKELGLLFQSCQVFESSVIAIAATARPNSLAASVLLSSVFARGPSLALQSDRPIKSHTLGVNLTLWVFASMLPTAMAGSCAVPKPHPHPRAQHGGCICLALPGSCCQAAPRLET